MSSGYKILLKYEVAYRRALESHRYDDNTADRRVYAIPCPAYPLPPSDRPRYRGVDRNRVEALSDDDARSWTAASPGGSVRYEATPATRFLREVELKTGRDDGWITSVEDVLSAWKLLGAAQKEYEMIYCREHADAASPGGLYEFLGFDAASFQGDNFSCICDALFFPRWHGTDSEGVLFLEHFNGLNSNGLFETAAAALDYLDFYTSFDWTERDGFTALEVFWVDPSPLRRRHVRQ